jgi:hypothetical protein
MFRLGSYQHYSANGAGKRAAGCNGNKSGFLVNLD